MSDAKIKISQALEKGAETSEYLKAYVYNQVQLQKLNASEIIGESAAKVTQKLISGALFAMMLFFLLLATAFWLASVLGSYIFAFLIIAGFLLLLIVVFALTKESMIGKPIAERASKAIFKNNLPAESEAELRQRIKRLELLLEESSRDIPDSIQNLSAKDFLPEEIQSLSNSFVVKSIRKVSNLFRN